MRRSLVVLATAALVAGTLAFAPAVTSQQAETTHQVTFTEDGSETIVGGPPGGINLTGFTEDELRCSSDPDAYCETILVTVEQPVADENPGDIEIGLGQLAIRLVSNAPGGDFDLYVRESDADASRGPVMESSGNASACAQVCGSGVPDPFGLWANQCDGVDECVEVEVMTNDLAGGGTSHLLVEIVYFASPERYTAELSYTRTDGRNADGTTPTEDEGAGAPAPADSADRVDVTGGFEATGDWGMDGNGGDAAPLGAALGQDIEAAFLEYAEDTFTFTIDVTSLPEAGGTPEASRYGWSFRYNDREFELDGKYTNYSRGACDPTAGNCPPPRDPGVGYFALRGNCTTVENVTTCEELGGTHATFDPADGTISIPVPAALLAPDGVEACDTIAGSASFIGESVWSAPSAFLTYGGLPYDDALHWVPLVVPHADPALSCDA